MTYHLLYFFLEAPVAHPFRGDVRHIRRVVCSDILCDKVQTGGCAEESHGVFP